MGDKLLISNLTWRSLEMQKNAFPDLPFFMVPDDLSSVFRSTRRQDIVRIQVLSLAILADNEKDFRKFLRLAKERGCNLSAKEEEQIFEFTNRQSSLEHIVKEWKLARNRGASKIGARISADKKMAATKQAIEKIKDRWPMPSDVWPTRTLLEEADISLNTAKAHLGKRPIAQYNYQAAQKRKERRNAKS